MRHVVLTCRNHPALRWSCKEIAFSDSGGYNGCRNIAFLGESLGRMYADGSGLECDTFIEDPTGTLVSDGKRFRHVKECDCSPRDLIRAPEDAQVRAEQP